MSETILHDDKRARAQEARRQRYAEELERARRSWAEDDAERFGGYGDEDPLVGDVDRWVHPDETRTEDQIAYDERYKVDDYDEEEVEEPEE